MSCWARRDTCPHISCNAPGSEWGWSGCSLSLAWRGYQQALLPKLNWCYVRGTVVQNDGVAKNRGGKV